MSLRKTVEKSALLMVFAQTTNMAMAFLTVVVVSRMLTVAEFGVAALGTVFFTVGNILAAYVIHGTLIVRQNLVKEGINTVFAVNLVLGVLVSGTLALIAPFVADFVEVPTLKEVLWVLALGVLFSSAGAVPNALRQINHDFTRVAIQAAILAVAIVPFTVTLAYLGFGSLSMSWSTTLYYGLMTVLDWAFTGWRPGPRTAADAAAARTARSTGFVVLGQWGVEAVQTQLDRGVIGSWLGPHSLGLYSMGRRLNDAIMEAAILPAVNVTVPLIASIQGQADRIRSAYLQALAVTVVVAVPVNIGLFCVGDLAILFVFGEKWIEAYPILQVFALVGIVNTVNAVQKSVVQGGGRPDIWLKVLIAQTVGLVIAILAFAPFGVYAVSIAIVARSWLLAPLAFRAVQVVTHVGYREQIRVLWPPAAAALAMAGAVLGLRAILPQALAVPVQLAVLMPVGAVVYVAVLALADIGLVKQVASLLFARFRRNR